jgi:hypothetical protein
MISAMALLKERCVIMTLIIDVTNRITNGSIKFSHIIGHFNSSGIQLHKTLTSGHMTTSYHCVLFFHYFIVKLLCVRI